jgi:hypothetical protein
MVYLYHGIKEGNGTVSAASAENPAFECTETQLKKNG